MIDEVGGASRRGILGAGLMAAGGLAIGGLAAGAASAMPSVQVSANPAAVRPDLLRRGLQALRFHGARVPQHDRVGLVDFARASSEPRFHIVELGSGRTTSLLVAHGSGSDPAHTGWLQRFSNAEGSDASSNGAFVATDYYVGKHGRSQRLVGLDPTNDNALARGLVVHSAWYSNPEMIAEHGMLGRSQGCLAVGESDLDLVFARLGQGRMIYADKV